MELNLIWLEGVRPGCCFPDCGNGKIRKSKFSLCSQKQRGVPPPSLIQREAKKRIKKDAQMCISYTGTLGTGSNISNFVPEEKDCFKKKTKPKQYEIRPKDGWEGERRRGSLCLLGVDFFFIF